MSTITESPLPPRRPKRPTRDIPPAPDTDLTPLRAHYLKKSLIQLQFNRELDLITSSNDSSFSTLSYLGPPFKPPPNDVQKLDLPFLKYIFRQYVLSFPFMAAAPKDFYSEKLQPFIASVVSRNLSPSSVLDNGEDNSEQAMRRKLLDKLERNLAMYISSATKIVEPEEVVRLNQADLERLEAIAQRRQSHLALLKDSFEVNVVGVRTISEKGRVRSRVHEEFIVRTRRSGHPDVIVSRRHGDFKTLADELRRAHPEQEIPNPPAKDRTTVNAVSTSTSPIINRMESRNSVDPDFSPSSNDYNDAPRPNRLAREKNRLTLRAYLHALLSSSVLASSPVLKSFLLSGPTTLTLAEASDARQREEADALREDARKRFAREIASRVDALRDAVKSVKGDIMGKDGLTRVFATIKATPDVRALPRNYLAVLEWARISLASTIYQQFVAVDTASETFAGLKRIHGLMPYFMLKTALKISNPVSMIRAILDLFLAQPFGGRSLLQRMFTSSLQEEVKALEEETEVVKDKVDDPVICEKIRQFVYAPREIQDMFKADAARENLNVLVVVLRSGENPVLSRAQIQRVSRAHRAHVAYERARVHLADSDDDDGPQDEDAWLIEDLRVLTHLYSRLRDREQLIALVFEGTTAELLRDIITIFYSPLAQVYRAASIADSLNDLQNFINDLIKTVEQAEEANLEDPQLTVLAFIDLVRRHEQAFYTFVHKVHSKGEGLFDGLMRWIELFITATREGLGGPLSLEFLLPHAGIEREQLLDEVDAVAKYHYRLKVVHEDKLRRRFGKAQEQGGADAEDEATRVLVNSVVGEMSFGGIVDGEMEDLVVEDDETDEDDESSEESEYETGSEGSESEGGSSTERTGETLDSPQPTPKVLSRHTTHSPAPPPKDNPLPERPPTTRQRSTSLTPQVVLQPGNLDPPQSQVRKIASLAHLSSPLPTTAKVPPTKPPPERLSKRGKKYGIVAPQLAHIPLLLPLFIEMMRPSLVPTGI